VAEAQETAELKSKIDEETKEAVRASSEAVSAIAKTNQELLASKDEGFTSPSIATFFSIHLLPQQS
jgi:two-component sensor histidine kinase